MPPTPRPREGALDSRGDARNAVSPPGCGAGCRAQLQDLALSTAPPRYLSSQMRQLGSVHLGFGLGLVDPELGGHDRWVRPTAEPLGVGMVGSGERVLPLLVDRVGGAEVH